VELSEDDIVRLLEERPPVIEELVRDGVDLAGVPIREWVGAASDPDPHGALR